MAERLGFLLAAAMLAGCAGGGTELPGPSASPIRVFVLVSPSDDSQPSAATTRVLARQWRLWSVQPLSADSSALESRGLLADSSGVLTLPPDSGTFLVEAWTNAIPPDSIDLRIVVATSKLPNSANCLTSLAAGPAPSSVRGCTQSQQGSPSSASGFVGSQLPDVVTMVHIPGNPFHQFMIVGTRGGDTLKLGETRLWKMDASLTFRGLLRRGSTPTPELPTLSSRESYLIEAWKTAGAAPSRIATHVVMDSLRSAYESCVVTMGDPLPATLVLHQCPLPAPNLSGGATPPDFWAALKYWPND